MDDLVVRLRHLAQSPVLLVASDFDGTLAPVSPHPSRVEPNPDSLRALHMLANLPQTHVAVISGRALNDLALVSGLSKDVQLVGSHGVEMDPSFEQRLSSEQVALRDRLILDVQSIAAVDDGLFVETKPAAVALHYRHAPSALADNAVKLVLKGPGGDPRVQVTHGKRVIELSVVPTNKGTAFSAIRHRVGASAALFIGDDASDEDAFAVLARSDVGIKVGEGDSKATLVAADTPAVAHILGQLAEWRASWLKSIPAVAIEHHALLSDQRTVALVTPDARIVWFCVPRIDSPALFAELLGGPTAGYFAVGPQDGSRPTHQTYLGNTFLLQTQWPTLTVTDYLDCSGGRPFQRAGRTDVIRVIEGQGRIGVEFAPRLDYGREPTRLRRVADGLQIEGTLDPIFLRAPGIDWTLLEVGPHQSALAEFELTGGALTLELRYGLSTTRELHVLESQRRNQTHRFWNTWADSLRIPPLFPELVRRSALVLKALCYGPSGAIAAAGTTSLPEHMGGVRNWDYRYCWLRDAALSAMALAKLGSTGMGMRLVDWLLGILDTNDAPTWLRPVYTVTGGHLGVEAEISELPGYRGSRPVRVGNAAALQLQLDVFGPIMEVVATLADQGAAISAEHWRLTEMIVHAVGQRWHEPDHGIWEIRGTRRHYVHSKVMCWVAIDRAVRLARVFSTQEPAEWLTLRDRIAADVLTHGWKPGLGAFAAAYEDASLDAAALQVGLSGLVGRDDPRVVRTVDAVRQGLQLGPTVYRYRFDDGLPGEEGGFHLCTSWMIEALALVGRVDEAHQLLQDFAALFGPTGLAPEEYCPKTKESLGNHPQAYTHVGLINAVLALSQLEAQAL